MLLLGKKPDINEFQQFNKIFRQQFVECLLAILPDTNTLYI